MNEENRLENAYKELQESQTPDLWQRIEANLEPRDAQPQEEHNSWKNSARRRNRIRQYGIGGAAACLCLISAMWLFSMPARQGTESVKAASEEAEAVYAEGAAEQQIAGETNLFDSHNLNLSLADGSEGKALWYQELPVYGSPAARPPENAVYMEADSEYFTEDILEHTDLLCMANVQSITYEAGADGEAWEAVYHIAVERMLYAADSRDAARKNIQVRAPLVGDGEGKPLYLMKEGGRYVLPLRETKDSCYLSFAFAPQIEATTDYGYVFHTGWQSLADDRTVVVKSVRQAPDDFYFDRMVYRQDSQFLPDLIVLIETLHKG